jgi:hypothetical protein
MIIVTRGMGAQEWLVTRGFIGTTTIYVKTSVDPKFWASHKRRGGRSYRVTPKTSGCKRAVY